MNVPMVTPSGRSVSLRNEASAEALLTLIQASAIGGFPLLVIDSNLGEDGWTTLAKAIKLDPGRVHILQMQAN